MKVIISEGIIKDAVDSGVIHKLHRLFYFACEGRHAVIPESLSEAEEWLASLDVHTKLVYQRALEFSARASSTLASNVSTVVVVAQGSDVWDVRTSSLTLDNAIAMLNEPLGILLENANNDWCFLYGVMKESERAVMARAIEERWAETLHGGGSDLIQRVTERAKSPAQRLRTFVLFDSDRRHPDELRPEWAPRQPEVCQGFQNESAVVQAKVGGYWRLRRRFIESYMPKSELAKMHETDKVESFFRLTTQAQWYFNMKKGFRGDEPAENAHRSMNLYGAVSLEDRKALHEGFGRKVADHYQNSKNFEFDWDADALSESAAEVPNLLRLL
ncbi:hypothetical protein IAE39_004009 [Pseudomonas sp. S37]|uniref:hypothetical protein n=1 Tax=Pseudomonas sp. S37 TaxID=2767449 RepID=UPI001914B34A|nr:hypothetical protein [Pseudomonas sp. S37]MBK4995835.1 hypothetical protein [Pseudomonas sp. S37]